MSKLRHLMYNLMKVLILGGNGMLGHKLIQVFRNKFEVWSTLRKKVSDFSDLNIFDKNNTFENIDAQDFEAVSSVIKELKPNIVINAVGVIKQKSDSKDVIKTLEINSIFPHKVAQVTQSIGAKFITFSTDCVFDGNDGNYTENDISNATDLYGRSKYLGEVSEENCLTLRTSIIGREIQTSNSLIEWFLGNKGEKVFGFTNAIYTGFPTIVISEILADIIEKHQTLQGIYHLSSDPINKYDLLNLVKSKLDLDIEIEPCSDFHIDRSLNSKKIRDEINFVPQTWNEMIESMLSETAFYDKLKANLSLN